MIVNDENVVSLIRRVIGITFDEKVDSEVKCICKKLEVNDKITDKDIGDISNYLKRYAGEKMGLVNSIIYYLNNNKGEDNIVKIDMMIQEFLKKDNNSSSKVLSNEEKKNDKKIDLKAPINFDNYKRCDNKKSEDIKVDGDISFNEDKGISFDGVDKDITFKKLRGQARKKEIELYRSGNDISSDSESIFASTDDIFENKNNKDDIFENNNDVKNVSFGDTNNSDDIVIDNSSVISKSDSTSEDSTNKGYDELFVNNNDKKEDKPTETSEKQSILGFLKGIFK